MNYNTKKEIEKYFIDNWTICPVTFDGEEFKTSNKWITVKYIPLGRTASTCQRVSTNSQLQVFCYDISPTLVIKLMDEVNQFFDCKQLVYSYSGIGSSLVGVQNLDNNVFEQNTIFDINTLI